MKRIVRERKGVSPIIATILLVAISLVLVGLIFVWVTQFIDVPKEDTPNMDIALSSYSDGRETYFKVQVTDIDREPSLNNVKYRVYDSGGTMLEELRVDSEVYGNLAHRAVYNGEELGVGFSDEDADGRLSTGDYFLIKQYFDKPYADNIDVGGGSMTLVYTPLSSTLENIEFSG